jgi:hypothetical protein
MGFANMDAKLLAAFNHFDLNGDGTINWDDLSEICKRLDPETWTPLKVDALMGALDTDEKGSISYTAFASWLMGEDDEGKRVLTIFEAEIARMLGERLADGDETDAGMDKISSYFVNALDIKPHEYALPKAGTKLTWLQEISRLLDPNQNPGGFRICQSVALEQAAVGPLLGLARNAKHDGVVTQSLEILARTAFGNEVTAAAVATHVDLVPTIRTLITTAKQPTKLATLQLVQAIVASSADSNAIEMIPKLLAEVIPLLADKTFTVLPLATFDIVVSASFSAPSAILQCIPGTELTSWFASNEEGGRPVWLDHDHLTVLACGLLATNVLGANAACCETDVDLHQNLQEQLRSGSFLEFFSFAVEAAVERREWPMHTGAYHSVGRLANAAFTLANFGIRQQLINIVEPLAKAVEVHHDQRITRLILQVLRNLAEDLSCLEKLLSLTDFRVETLEVLHKAGDEKEATELISCMVDAENTMSAAESAFRESEHLLKNPPSVKSLAVIFNRFSPMHEELSVDQLLQALRAVPVGPSRDVRASLNRDKSAKFSFGAFAQRIYGTPTLLGWWPSLMEHTDEMWNHPMFQELSLPPLADLLSYFELGAKGAPGLDGETIMNEVLPAWKLPIEGELVEDLFAEIRGDELLNFRQFGTWMCRYFKALDKQRREAEEENLLRQAEDAERSQTSPPA